MEKDVASKWTDKIKNAVVLERVGEGRIMLELIRKRKRNWLGHKKGVGGPDRPAGRSLDGPALEGMVNGKNVRVRRRYEMIDNIIINGLYEDTKRKVRRGESAECCLQ